MKTAPKFLAALGVLGALAVACDIQKISNQSTAPHVMVATVLVTPPFDVNLATLPPDASIPDGGSFDAGGFLIDAGVLTIPPQNLVTVFFGERQGTSLEAVPTGVPGATVTLRQAGGGSWALPEVGGGNYLLAGDDAGFTYTDDATYTFEVVLSGATYTAQVTKVPPLERITAFHPPTNTIDLAAGQDFTFTRPDPPSGQERTLGFVSVFPVSPDGGQGQLTYTNVPQTPLQFIKLALAPLDWKDATVRVPGSAFPSPGSFYVMVLQSARLGGPESDNLFIGSAILAGTAEVGVVKTAP